MKIKMMMTPRANYENDDDDDEEDDIKSVPSPTGHFPSPLCSSPNLLAVTIIVVTMMLVISMIIVERALKAVNKMCNSPFQRIHPACIKLVLLFLTIENNVGLP